MYIGLTDHFNTRILTTLNYSAIVDFHTLQITSAHAKIFQPTMFSSGISWERILTIAIPLFSCSSPLCTAAPSSWELLLQISLYRDWISKSNSKLLYVWQFTANQFVLESSPLRTTTKDPFPQLNSCGISPYVTTLEVVKLTTVQVSRLPL
jgi:hypothetical protein